VLAALVLAAWARERPERTPSKRAINVATKQVAEVLGNTPAVARRAYIDPRVFDRFQSGWTIKVGRDALDGAEELLDSTGRARRAVELAVLDLVG
jgi:DNA topoisomerase I